MTRAFILLLSFFSVFGCYDTSAPESTIPVATSCEVATAAAKTLLADFHGDGKLAFSLSASYFPMGKQPSVIEIRAFTGADICCSPSELEEQFQFTTRVEEGRVKTASATGAIFDQLRTEDVRVRLARKERALRFLLTSTRFSSTVPPDIRTAAASDRVELTDGKRVALARFDPATGLLRNFNGV